MRKLKTAYITEKDFYGSHIPIIESEGVDLQTGIINIVNRYAVNKLKESKDEPDYPKSRKLNKTELVSKFVNNNITRTDSREDRIPLRDLYELYESQLISEGLISRVLSKQAFRGHLQSMGLCYGKGDSNKNLFRYVKLVEQDDDEEWEL